MQTLLLSNANNDQSWDLMVDASRNIAVAPGPYSLAQDAASAIKLFSGEDYYDTTRGVLYWEQILGHWPPISLMDAIMVAAALTVPGVVQAVCTIDSVVDRRPSGTVEVTDRTGAISRAGF